MAVPGRLHARPASTPLPGIPVVVWALHETGLVDGDFDHASITTQGATVGAPMLSNMFARTRRPFELVLGSAGRPGRRRAGAGGAARRPPSRAGIRRARLGRIGDPIEGYLHVDVAGRRPAARRPGIEAVGVDPDEVVDAYRAVRRRASGRSTRRSARAGRSRATSSRRVAGAQPAGGAGARGRGRRATASTAAPSTATCPSSGSATRSASRPAGALGRLTSMGMPFTCTGDILTAVAMLVTKRLGGAALYHEIEAIDYATGEVVIANSGEHDLAWLAPRASGRGCAATAGSAARTRAAACARYGAARRPRHARGLHAAPRCARRVPASWPPAAS